MQLLKLKSELLTLDANHRLYNVNTPILAVTGGIASGKSTVTQKLQQLGAPVICADALVKKIYQTPQAYNFLELNFPDCIHDKKIDFKLLRQKVFNDVKAKSLVENFIYPKLKDLFIASIPSGATFIVYDVPLLFEKKLEKLVDANLLVYCPKEIQIQRLMKRDAIDKELAEKILLEQNDIEEKKQKAQFLLDNSSTPKQLDSNFQILIPKIWDIA